MSFICYEWKMICSCMDLYFFLFLLTTSVPNAPQNKEVVVHKLGVHFSTISANINNNFLFSAKPSLQIILCATLVLGKLYVIACTAIEVFFFKFLILKVRRNSQNYNLLGHFFGGAILWGRWQGGGCQSLTKVPSQIWLQVKALSLNWLGIPLCFGDKLEAKMSKNGDFIKIMIFSKTKFLWQQPPFSIPPSHERFRHKKKEHLKIK